MGHATNRAELFDVFAGVGKALSSSSRLQLIELLAQGPRGVMELAETAEMNVTTASAHLQNLKRAGLVTTRRDGTTIRYRLSSDKVAALFGQLCEVAVDLGSVAEAIDSTPTGAGAIESISHEALVRRAGLGEILVLDVRPPLEYAAGHIPGSISIPLAELPARMGELPDDISIVAYCRGKYCRLSHEAAHVLQAAGHQVFLFEDGIVEWRRAGRELSTTES